MAFIIPFLGIAAGALSTMSSGNLTEKSAKETATRLNLQAGQEQAAGEAATAEDLRQGSLVSSRAKALTAASGGSVSDPTAQKTLGDLAAETEYRAMLSLYEGDSRASRLRDQANVTIYSGKLGKQAAYSEAGASALSDFSSIYSRYRTPTYGAPSTHFAGMSGPGALRKGVY